MDKEDRAVRVLVVEDDPLLAQLVVKYLEREDFTVEYAPDGVEAVTRARNFTPDVVILDIGLPRLDGLEVARQLRQFSDCYIVMLTARDDEVDKLVGLAVGADDYLTKPFSHRELVARVKAMLRRPHHPDGPDDNALSVGPLRVDRAAREIHLDAQPVSLTPTEFDLLATLAANPRTVLSRRQLIDAVWGTGWGGDERMVDVHIRNLRRKLGDDAASPRFCPHGARCRLPDRHRAVTPAMPRQRPATLRTRLVVGNLVLIATALAVTWTVATVAGPPLFRDHIEQDQDQALPPGLLDRAEQAFHIANLLQVLLATAIAGALTVGLSLLITRPVSRTITAMAATSARVAHGDYTARLVPGRASREVHTLAGTINTLATRIQNTEATRRRMLTDLAHEMRTPLATIDGYLEAIRDGIEPADPPTIAILRGQLQKLVRLADDINAVSAADEHRLTLAIRPTPVDEIIEDAAESLRPAYSAKGVTLRVTRAPGTLVDADPARIGQVLINVLNNALRHTPSGGQVDIDTGTGPVTTEITIRDTGEGIPPEHLPYLFERFYRAHPSGHHRDQGSGVGLTISRAIVAAHAGSIAVESPEFGPGAIVRIKLPTGGPRNASTLQSAP
jgi:two-component system sensor histidine kinase BaeS